MFETFGSGVAWIDMDNDGFVDLYFVNGGFGTANVLYRNNGERDVHRRDRRLRRGRQRHQRLQDRRRGRRLRQRRTARSLRHRVRPEPCCCRNLGNGKFADVTAAAGVAGGANEWSTSTGFLDYDRDGDLDLYVANYVDFRIDENPWCGHAPAGLSDVLQSHHLRRRGRSALPQQRRRHLHRRLAAGRHRQSGRQGTRRGVLRFRSRRTTSTSTSPTTWCATSSIATTATARSRTSPTRPASASTSTASRRPGWASTVATSTATGCPELFVTNFSEELNTLYAEPRRRDLRGRLAEDRTRLGLPAARDSAPSCSTTTTTATSTCTSPTATSSTTSSSISRTCRTNRAICSTRTWAGSSRTCRPQSGAALRSPRVGRGLAVADFDNDGFLDVAISSLGRTGGAAEEPRRLEAATGCRFAPRARTATDSGSARPCGCRRPGGCRSARSTTPPAT